MNRSELIFLYDIKDNNPNGDPIDQNKPRIDEETGINIVTDVRLKRTIRDYLKEYKSKEIFVREIRDDKGKVQDGKTRAKDFGKKKNEIIENILKECIDVRLFGATIPLAKDSATFTGPVQFNMGRSLHKVEVKRIKGTGAFASGENKDNKTFREEFILPYSLIGFYGIINEKAAEQTKLTEDDINLLIDAMWNGTQNLISRSKVGQVPRLLIKVNYKEEFYHIGDLLKSIKIESEKEDEQIRDVEDFILNVDELIEILEINKEKIDNLEIKLDRRLNMKTNIIDKLGEIEIKTEEILI
ncbi:type I-B CRISPR-associated protein Cas7/Csh2 [Schnuerera sp. xch1]|uniref:type I-B CRISPR-associated protein Cas7/Csh2 n=1 Tax=Schnuerera sp. xch1 TaxID=2874283 RepID=UPI001CBF5D80|nr:type I-B CRISPR-associated protein Cas7/Csh2 [Schnuerera sp. xch1]MBZ2175795.1 type I-B CRISPR-associated protein Cas7/Csh2 [Schnuerera sp. xch1]